MISLQKRLLYVLLLAALVPFLVVAIYSWSSTSTWIKSQIRREMATLARAKQDTLDNHLQHFRAGAASLAGNDAVTSFLAEHASDHEEAEKSPAHDAALHALRQYQEANWGALHHVFLANAEGTVVLSPPHGDSTASHLHGELDEMASWPQVLQSPQFTDFFGFSEKNHFHQLCTYPVKGEDDATAGAIVLEVCIDHIEALLQRDLELGETGRLYMTTLDGTHIVHSTDEKQPAQMRPGIESALQDGLANGEFETNNGDPVVGAYVYDEQYPWVLCAEMATSEVYAPLRRHLQTFGGLAAVVLVSAIGLSILVARRISRPISRLSAGLNEAADQVGEAAQQVATASQELAAGASTQATALQETASAMQELSTSTQQNASHADRASGLSTQARDNTQAGDATVTRLDEAMSAINDGSSEIGKIIKVIEEIAFQTNLLALNAAVEAARAGEHGKGFAVVAEEVRSLAQRSAQAAGETTRMIEDSVRRAHDGSVAAASAGDVLRSIGGDVSDVAGLLEGIRGATTDQVRTVELINAAVCEIDTVTQTNAAGAEESASAAEQLSAQVQTMKRMIADLGKMTGG